MKQINCKEFNEWKSEKKDYHLLDVREQWEHNLVKIEGSILAPLNTLMAEPPDLDKSKPVVVYCRTGKRSLVASQMLVNMGFQEVYNLAGGIHAWSDEIDPTIEKY